MKKLITLALLCLSAQCYAMPDMRKFENEHQSFPWGESYCAKKGKEIEMTPIREKDLSYYSGHDVLTGYQIYIRNDEDLADAVCLVYKDGESFKSCNTRCLNRASEFEAASFSFEDTNTRVNFIRTKDDEVCGAYFQTCVFKR